MYFFLFQELERNTCVNCNKTLYFLVRRSELLSLDRLISFLFSDSIVLILMIVNSIHEFLHKWMA